MTRSDSAESEEVANEKFLQDLLDKSRKNDGARKHHVVPNSYLRRWAGTSGQVQVTDLETRKTFPSSPVNAARVTDFYRVDSPDLDPVEMPPAFVENMLSIIEGRAVPALDNLLAKGVSGLTGQDRGDIATFLGFQAARGQQTRNMITGMAADMSPYMHSADMTMDGIKAQLETNGVPFSEEVLAEFREFQEGLKDGSIVMLPQQAVLVGMPMSIGVEIAEVLFSRHWVLFRTSAVLLTCDEPVVPIGGPGRPRTQRSGMGTAPVVVFPVAPDAMLAMFLSAPGPTQRAPLNLVDLAELNREITAAASRWAIDRKGRKTALAFDIPAWPDSVVKTQEHAITGGTLIEGSWLNRWAGTDTPPDWPVIHWFT